MDEKNKGEDLYDELKKTLEAVEESEEEETSVATDQKPTVEDKPLEEETVEDENTELTEEEISKLHPKAQKRIKDLAEQLKTLAEKPADKTPEDAPDEKKTENSHEFKTVEEFLGAVQDEDSRKLLESFYKTIKGEISTTLSPIEKANNEAKFNEEFTKYEKIEGITDYRNDIKKTFMRNPNQSMKSLVGEIITDISLKKLKPIENKPSSPNRNGKVDTEGKSLEELYEILDSTKE